ncbi:DUF6779 domain-containing protein [Gordonia soli]|uniref:DUF6779 domain-containing protein n=1 Tax=Gordonia soli NBRC 108243 TaxID=1223545 RepID=M0QHK1_9ACTN|nr:DUF6779 domain-containing protein [Gordonia soli]GAC68125.1 hypothetical protein GS4_11_03970 [Gordonia soli NBRC 108243]
MTTPNGRSTEGRRAGRSVGQWLLGLLIVLALVASILMVFTDKLSIVGSLAVIAALWAAVIGAILVTRFRRQADSAEAKSRDLRLVYELQLEREIAARRQYELDVEATIRKEVGAEANEQLAELKQQVLALRSSLELLLGESLPEQRAALPNEKLRELASGLGQHLDAPDDGTLAARDFAATAPSADNGRHIPAGVDPNEMTEVIPIVTDDVPISGRIAAQVPDPGYRPYGTQAAAQPADDTIDATVTEDPAADERGDLPADQAPADVETVEPAPGSVPFTPPEYGGVAYSAPGQAGHTHAGQAQSGQSGQHERPDAGPYPQAPRQPWVEDAPTDQWAAPPSAVGGDANGVATGDDAADVPGAGDAAPDQTPTPFAPGRHESSVDASVAGRRRRRDEDVDSAHSAGLPVSELLSQLRQSGGAGGGRRRRDD